MFVRNLFFTALAVAGLASAQSNATCTQKNITIENSGDLSKISSCKTFDGDVIIGKGIDIVELSNLEEIKGSLTADGSKILTRINMPKLKSIGGTFKLQSLEALTDLSLAELSTVGNIEWITLNQIRKLSSMKITKVSSIRISDTALESLDGFDLQTVVTLSLDNNRYLKNVNMGLRNVSDSLSMQFNSDSIAISFPELIWAKNMTILSAGSIDLPKLQHVNGSMNFGSNNIETISCKNLTTVEQTLAVIGNSKLTKLDFSELVLIGGALKIHNNSMLANIDGFPKLETVRGAVDFVGKFSNASLPKLENVEGGFNLQTTEDFDCSQFNKYKSSKVIQGDGYVCKGKQKDPVTKDGKSGSDGGSGSDDKGAASRFGVSAIFGLTFAAIAFAL